MRRSTMKRVRKGRRSRPRSGFIVTWDVNSVDRSASNRLYRRIFGDTTYVGGRVYRYPGFLEKEGVRYLGQSVIFVPPLLLNEILDLLRTTGIDDEITPATLG